MAKREGTMKRRRWDSKTKTKIVLEGLLEDPYQRYATSTEYIRINTTAGGISSYLKLIERLNQKERVEK
jgi:hypothetical protein